jgi:hypothetical protein
VRALALALLEAPGRWDVRIVSARRKRSYHHIAWPMPDPTIAPKTCARGLAMYSLVLTIPLMPYGGIGASWPASGVMGEDCGFWFTIFCR